MSAIAKTPERSSLQRSIEASDQRTLSSDIELTGQALFSGEDVVLRLRPAAPDTGILFQRVDFEEKPVIPARLDYVQSALRCTKIGNGHASVQTVEHLMAALQAMKIDNLIVEINGSEVPIFDGSADVFIDKISQCGVESLKKPIANYTLKQPVYWSSDEVHLIALPSDELRVSFTLHFPSSNVIGTQFYSYVLEQDSFIRDIAPARTFAIYEEIAPMMEAGYIKGGSLENAIIVREEKIINPDGLRFKDEMVRHKILDLIGDLSLIGKSFKAHIIAVRSGHASNIAFAKKLVKELVSEEESNVK